MRAFKKFRKYYWITQEFLRRHYKKILSATIVAIAAIVLVSWFAKYIPTPKPTTRIARIGKYSPNNIPQDILSKVSTGLVTTTDDGSINPGIAKSWEVQEEGTKYTFTLNDSLKWHDQTRVKPEDIKYQFREVEQSEEDGKIVFKLKEPFAPFLSVLSQPVLKNERYGTGTYQIARIKSPASVLQSITLISPKDKIIYKFYPTEDTALTAFKLGEVDKIEHISFVPESIRSEKNINVEEVTNEIKIAALFFNNNDNILQSKSARQGLAYAIEDKSGENERALSPITSDSWAYNPNVKSYNYDPERARDLFGQDLESTENITIELKTMLQYLDTAERIAQDWEEVLGIDVDVKVTSSLADSFQAVLVDYAPPEDPDQYSIWHSTQSTNFTHYQNLRVDQLLEDGRRTLDQEMREQIYMDFQRFLLEDSPAVFLFYTSNYTISRDPLVKI